MLLKSSDALILLSSTNWNIKKVFITRVTCATMLHAKKGHADGKTQHSKTSTLRLFLCVLFKLVIKTSIFTDSRASQYEDHS
jgi:hypothetical protein